MVCDGKQTLSRLAARVLGLTLLRPFEAQGKQECPSRLRASSELLGGGFGGVEQDGAAGNAGGQAVQDVDERAGWFAAFAFFQAIIFVFEADYARGIPVCFSLAGVNFQDFLITAF